jgi:outer membrane protein TolC
MTKRAPGAAGRGPAGRLLLHPHLRAPGGAGARQLRLPERHRRHARRAARLAAVLRRPAPARADRHLAGQQPRPARRHRQHRAGARAVRHPQRRPLPTVGAAATATRQPSTTARNEQANLFTAGLALTSWEIDFFGRIAALSQAALAQYLATEEGRKAAQISLVSSVATTWLSLVADEELLGLTQQTLQTREESFRLTKLRFDNGVSNELDLRLAQSLAESARVALRSNSGSARWTSTPWRCCWAGRCRPTSPAAPPWPRWRWPTCRRACPPTCWPAAPTCARPSSS